MLSPPGAFQFTVFLIAPSNSSFVILLTLQDVIGASITFLIYSFSSFISLSVFDTIDLGTHTMFICDVTEAITLSDADSMTYAYYHANVKPKPNATKKKGYVCKICGYVYENEPLPDDFICPICKHGADDFEKIQ